MMILDSTGQDIGQILREAADRWLLPEPLLLACALAESTNLNPNAFRFNGLDDTSYGPFQQVGKYAGAYGIGDGTISNANIALCKTAFANWRTAVDVAGPQLKEGLRQADSFELVGDARLLGALCKYNAGSTLPLDSYWWTSEQHGNYVAALADAKQRLAEYHASHT